jgi:hypothetical protein
MVTDRLIKQEDLSILEESLKNDDYHKDTRVGFFLTPDSITKVYELDEEPVLFARACKALIMDLQFLDNNNVQANRKVMEEGFPILTEMAKKNGFNSIIFQTSNPLLQRFCERKLKFETIGETVLRKVL